MSKEGGGISFGAPLVGAKWSGGTSKTETGFVDRAGYGKALREAFNGRVKGPPITTTPDGTQVLRANKTGLFNLKSFLRVLRPPGPPPPLGGQTAPSPGQSTGTAPAPKPAPTFDERLTAATQRDLQGKIDSWQDKSSTARDPKASDQAKREAALARDALVQDIRSTQVDLRKLEAELKTSALDPEARKVAQASIDQAKLRCAHAAVALALPGLAGPPKDAVPDAAKLDALARSLVALDDKMSGSGATDYALDKMMGVLVNHARIRELADAPLEAKRTDALEGLHALVDTMLDAVKPGRDGAALNGLIGLSGELDGALKALRIQSTTTLMLQQVARSQGVPVGQLSDSVRAEATKDAKALVEREFDIAKAKQQIQRALERSGVPRTLGGVGGISIDSALINGLRNVMGANAKEIGIIIGGLLMMERALAESPEAQRLLQDVQTELVAKRQERALLEKDLGIQDDQTQARTERFHALGDDIRYLEMREGGLQSEEARVTARLKEASGNLAMIDQAISGTNSRIDTLEKRIAELEIHLDTAASDVEALDELGECRKSLKEEQSQLTHLTEKREMSSNALDYWDARLTQVSIPPAMQQARAELDRASAKVQRLETEIGALDKTINEAREKIESAPDDVETLSILSAAQARLTAATSELKDARVERHTAMEALLEQQQAHIDQHGPTTLFAGLGPKELKAMGLSDSDAREVMDAMRGLSKQGLSSAKEVRAVLSTVNTVMGKLNATRFGVDGAIGREMGVLKGSKDEERAQHLGDLLLRNLSGDLEARALDAHDKVPAKRDALAKTMSGVLAPPDGTLGPLTQAKHNPKLDDLRALGQQHARLEGKLVGLADDLNGLDAMRASAQQTLTDFNSGAPGRAVKLDHPEGLQSSLRVREAIDLYRATGGLTTATPEQKARFEKLCEQLKGFDGNKLHTPWHSRTPFTIETVRQLANDAVFNDAIDAIIVLRQEEPRMREALNAEIVSTVGAMDLAVSERGDNMGSKAYVALRDAVRGAIIAQMGATPGATVANFRPAEHAEAIKQTLVTWGVPIDEARPEIDTILSQSFGPDELNLWARSTTLTPEVSAKMEAALQGRVDKLNDKDVTTSGIRPETKLQLFDSIDKLQLGTKVKLTVGDRVEMQTGSIPVEPTGIVGVNVKVAVGKLDGIEIARGSDGYELVLRDGWDGKVGADLTAKLWESKALGMKCDATAGLEAAGFRVSGAALRFPNTPAGKEAMKAVLESLFTQGTIQARDLSRVENVMPLVESKIGGKVSGGARFGVDYGTTDGLKGTGHQNASVGVGVRVGVTAGISGTSFDARNTNMTIHKGEREMSVEASLTGGAYFRIGIPKEGNKTHNASTDLMEGSVSRAFVYKSKSKEVRGADGLVQTGTERVAQMFMPPGFRQDAVGKMGGQEFRDLIGRLQSSGRPEDLEMANEIATLIRSAGGNDMVSITSSLDERVRGAVNDKLSQAKALRAGRIDGGGEKEALATAKRLEGEAQAMLDDDKNYIISKIQLIPTRETTEQLTPLNLVFVRWNAYTEDKGEFVAAEIKFDAKMAREVHDALRT
jgi:hypothetical protein